MCPHNNYIKGEAFGKVLLYIDVALGLLWCCTESMIMFC